jgi:hypothetical protein
MPPPGSQFIAQAKGTLVQEAPAPFADGLGTEADLPHFPIGNPFDGEPHNAYASEQTMSRRTGAHYGLQLLLLLGRETDTPLRSSGFHGPSPFYPEDRPTIRLS